MFGLINLGAHRESDVGSGRVEVLLVEDSLMDQKLMKQWFQSSTVIEITHIVDDGGEVLDSLRVDREGVGAPRLVLLDLNLPRVSGFEVLSAMRSSDDLHDIPVIVLASDIDRERCEELGADLVIQKPSDADGFSQMIETVEGFVRERGICSPD